MPCQPAAKAEATRRRRPREGGSRARGSHDGRSHSFVTSGPLTQETAQLAQIVESPLMPPVPAPTVWNGRGRGTLLCVVTTHRFRIATSGQGDAHDVTREVAADRGHDLADGRCFVEGRQAHRDGRPEPRLGRGQRAEIAIEHHAPEPRGWPRTAGPRRTAACYRAGTRSSRAVEGQALRRRGNQRTVDRSELRASGESGANA